MSLNPTILNVSLSSGETNVFGNVSDPANFVHQSASSSAPLGNGTGSGQANHGINFNLACNGGVTLDFTGTGAATGLDGKNRDFSNANSGGAIKTLIIENLDLVNAIIVTQPGSNGWTGINGAATGLSHSIEPGGLLVIHSPIGGKAVSSTNKLLTLTGNATAKISAVGIAA